MPANLRKPSLLLFLALGIYIPMALAGIRYGLPDAGHIMSYNCDEGWLEFISRLKPAEHKFNPHPDLGHPTLYLFTYAGALYAAGKLHYIPLNQSKDWYRTHPDILARFYLVGRYLQVLCGIALLLMTWFLSRALFNEWTANVATLLLSVTPSLIAASHFSQANIPVALLSFAALASMLIYAHSDHKPAKWLYSAAFFLGCAISTKFSALGLLPVLAYNTLYSYRKIKVGLICAGLLILGFFIGTPFSLLAPHTFWPVFFVHINAQLYPVHGFLASLLYPIQYALNPALGQPLLIATLLAVAWSIATKKTPVQWTLLIWIFSFYIGVVRAGYSATSGRLLIVLPALMLVTTLFFDRLQTAIPKVRRAVNISVGCLMGATLMYSLAIVSLRRAEPLQKQASAWIENNIPRDKSIGLPREIFWWTPDIIYQSALHPERSIDPYKIVDLQFSSITGEIAKPDYIVASTVERRHCNGQHGTTAQQCREFDQWLDDGNHYAVAKIFPRHIALWGWTWNRPEILNGFDDDLWTSTLTIYKRIVP